LLNTIRSALLLLLFTALQIQAATYTINSSVTTNTPPAGGRFDISLRCQQNGVAVTTITPSATQSAPLVGATVFSGIPLGAYCTIEYANFPTAPIGTVWATVQSNFYNHHVYNDTQAFDVSLNLANKSAVSVTNMVTGGALVPGTKVDVSLSCNLYANSIWTGPTPNTLQSLDSGQSVLFDNIPQGAQCQTIVSPLPNPPSGYDWVDQTISPNNFSVNSQGTYQVDVTNTMGAFKPVTISVDTTGGPASVSALVYSVELRCTGFNTTIVPSPAPMQSVANGGSVVFGAVPVGANCRVSLTNLPTPPVGYMWHTASFSNNAGSSVKVGAAGLSVQVTNRLVKQSTLRLSQILTGGSLPSGALFSSTIYCTFEGMNIYSISPTNLQTQAANSSVEFSNIPAGAVCSFNRISTPTPMAGFFWLNRTSFSPSTILLVDGANEVTATDTLTGSTNVTVNFNVTGGTPVAGAEIMVNLFCNPLDGSYFGNNQSSHTVPANGSYTFTNVPIDYRCGLTVNDLPAAPANKAWLSPYPTVSSTLTTLAGGNSMNVTAQLVDSGQITINATLNGGSFPNGTYSIYFNCNSRYISGTFTLSAPLLTQSAPLGDQCNFYSLNLPTPPTGFIWGDYVIPSNTIAITAGSNIFNVTLNLIPLTSLSISLQTTGSAADPGSKVPFSLTCRKANGDYYYNASFTYAPADRLIGAGETLTVGRVPIGYSCAFARDLYIATIGPGVGKSWGAISYSPIQITAAVSNLPASASIQVNQNTTVQVTSTVLGGVPVANSNLTVTLYCSYSSGGVLPKPNATLTMPMQGGTISYSDIPVGSSCSVSVAGPLPAPPANLLWKNTAYNDYQLTVTSGSNTVNLTNTLLVEAPLAIDQTLIGGVLAPGVKLNAVVTCYGPINSQSISRALSIEPNARTMIYGVPLGYTCNLQNNSGNPLPPLGYSWAIPTFGAPVVTSNTLTVLTYAVSLLADTSITINKVLIGNISPSHSYNVTYNCSNSNSQYSYSYPGPVTTKTIVANGSVVFNKIPEGSTCTFSESNLPAPPAGTNWKTPVFSPATLVTAANINHTVTLTNELTTAGSLTVNLAIQGGTLPAGTNFSIYVSCSLLGSTVYNGSGLIAVNQAKVFDNIPLGATCVVQQNSNSPLPTLPAGKAWTDLGVLSASNVPITSGGNALTVTNTFADTTLVAVYIQVNGGTIANTDISRVSLACQMILNNNYVSVVVNPSIQQNISLAAPAIFSNIPQKAICTASLVSISAPPSGSVWTHLPYQVLRLTAAAGINVLTLPLTLSPTTSVTLRKAVSIAGYSPTENFSLSINCSINQNQFPVNTIYYPVSIGIAKQVNNIPVGSTCNVTENMNVNPPAPAGFAWTAPTFSQNNFVVPEGGTTVTVTNAVIPVTTLTVNRLGTGVGLIQDSGYRLQCGTTCTYASGVPVSLRLIAYPGGNSKFMGWIGGGCSGTGPCDIVLSTSKTVTAVFANISFVPSLDIDRDGKFLATTDGLLVNRYLRAKGLYFDGFAGDITTYAALRYADGNTWAHLTDMAPSLDIDGDGELDAATDGLLVSRYLLGLRGTALTQNALSANARFTAPADIESRIAALIVAQ
jgi:Domain of unknown function (DUF5979)